ncbi:hypothetical protein SEA_HEATHER_49 [Streptomyces phage Heather]|uniref:Uncharacterized protein n=1 Tax=Streptomyces phage Heather TaxID=2562343 RepID=A0A4D6E428_9CAUD|nr:hypothetical protein SEA_HEATHER_49 [Streptomyces phage Heather]
MRKITFAASTLASAATAFGIGALVFSGQDVPADAVSKPQPTRTVTASPTAPEKGAQSPRTDTPAKAVQAGSKGPFKDAQGDGKHLDDIGKAVMPNGLGVHIPDALLPWHEPYVDPADATETGTSTSDDVVSAPNVITDPDKPWFDLPTEPATDTTSSDTVASQPADEPAPAPSSAPVVSGPVRTGGLVTGTRPVFNTVTDTVSSLVPE